MADTTSKADEILRLKELLDQGILTQEEFDAQKKQILSAPQQAQPQQPIYQQQAPPPQYFQPPPAPAAPPIIINNTATAKAGVGRIRRKRSVIFDIFMIFITGGLWIIWMILRPKYH